MIENKTDPSYKPKPREHINGKRKVMEQQKH